MYKKYNCNPSKIQTYIKNRCNLGISAKLIFNEIQALYGDHAISYRTVASWTKKLREGVESLEDNPRTGRKVSKLIRTDARYTISELAKATDISISKVHFILKKNVCSLEIFLQGGYHICCQTTKRGHV